MDAVRSFARSLSRPKIEKFILNEKRRAAKNRACFFGNTVSSPPKNDFVFVAPMLILDDFDTVFFVTLQVID